MAEASQEPDLCRVNPELAARATNPLLSEPL